MRVLLNTVLLVIFSCSQYSLQQPEMICFPADQIPQYLLTSSTPKYSGGFTPGRVTTRRTTPRPTRPPTTSPPVERLPLIHRNQVEYPADIECPTQFLDDPRASPRPGYRVCTKANIAACTIGSTWQSPSPRCQQCTCPDGRAHCNKIPCSQVLQGTPLPGKAPLTSKYRVRIYRGKLGDCTGCTIMARQRIYAYCVCDNPSITAKKFFNQ